MNYFPGIVIFIISGFYLLMSDINAIKTRREHESRDAAGGWGACKGGWDLPYDRGEPEAQRGSLAEDDECL